MFTECTICDGKGLENEFCSKCNRRKCNNCNGLGYAYVKVRAIKRNDIPIEYKTICAWCDGWGYTKNK